MQIKVVVILSETVRECSKLHNKRKMPPFRLTNADDLERSPCLPLNILDIENEDAFKVILLIFDLHDSIEVRNLINIGIVLQELGHKVAFVACKYKKKSAPAKIRLFPVYTVIIQSFILVALLKCSPA